MAGRTTAGDTAHGAVGGGAMKKRYFVDERSGCLAVRDCNNTDIEYLGLHPDTKGVVKYWDSHQVFETCPTCNHEKFAGYEIDEDDINEAIDLCYKLNQDNKQGEP